MMMIIIIFIDKIDTLQMIVKYIYLTKSRFKDAIRKL